MSLDSIKDSLVALMSALTGCCCQQDATLKLNGRSFKIIKLLGEGGFSYVYLAQDLASGRQFALKKIRCPLGSESVRVALKEVEAYKRFRHPNIIRCLDSCVVQDKDEDGKVIYLFLPFYKNGTVQNIISANAVNNTPYPELSMLSIFHGTCLALRAMHHYVPGKPSYPPPPSASSSTTRLAGHHESSAEDDDEDEEGRVMRGDGEGEALIGGEERLKEAVREGEAIAMSKVGGGSSSAEEADGVGGGDGQVPQPWAHRDIKPANIMIADDGITPILMDFGSALAARIPIPNRQVALTQQDLAAEHCSMPFRAPELFDVKTGTDLTEAVDIWSLGTTLYAMAYGTSPFETTQQSEHGGSIMMAVLNGKYSFPAGDGNYSEGFRDMIRAMLVVKASERPDIDRVIEMTQNAMARLQ